MTKKLNIEIDNKEIIPLNEFVLAWRWKKTHNPDITESEKELIQPVTEIESKRLNKVIDFFELEDNLRKNYNQTDWVSADSENDKKIERFRMLLKEKLESWNDDVIITWNRRMSLKTTKKIFIKYWDDFLYPSSDDVTIISQKTNWIIFYRHFEVANIWTIK